LLENTAASARFHEESSEADVAQKVVATRFYALRAFERRELGAALRADATQVIRDNCFGQLTYLEAQLLQLIHLVCKGSPGTRSKAGPRSSQSHSPTERGRDLPCFRDGAHKRALAQVCRPTVARREFGLCLAAACHEEDLVW
jgi:hypothetical protein